MAISQLSKQLGMTAKDMYQRYLLKPDDTRQIGFIVGSQRSGTRMLQQTFQRDFGAKIFGERSLSAGGEGKDAEYRLRPYHEIEEIFAAENASLYIVRCLVESQNILKLLDHFPDAKAIWLYRYFQDVGSSSLKKFGNDASDYNLRSVIDSELSDHWFGEGASDNTKAVVRKYFGEALAPGDAKALIWYVRNSLFFELGLDQNPRVILCRYEDIVTQPKMVFKGLYTFLGRKYPGDYMVKHIHTQSVGKGRNMNVTEALRLLCEDLTARMNEVYAGYDVYK